MSLKSGRKATGRRKSGEKWRTRLAFVAGECQLPRLGGLKVPIGFWSLYAALKAPLFHVSARPILLHPRCDFELEWPREAWPPPCDFGAFGALNFGALNFGSEKCFCLGACCEKLCCDESV